MSDAVKKKFDAKSVEVYCNFVFIFFVSNINCTRVLQGEL